MFYVFLAKKNWSLSPLKLKIWQSERPRRVCGYVIILADHAEDCIYADNSNDLFVQFKDCPGMTNVWPEN